ELLLVPRDCDPETELPPVPASRFPTSPADRAALLEAIYAAYEPGSPAIDQEYPPGFADKSAVFLARVRIRLEDVPSSTLDRHAESGGIGESHARAWAHARRRPRVSAERYDDRSLQRRADAAVERGVRTHARSAAAVRQSARAVRHRAPCRRVHGQSHAGLSAERRRQQRAARRRSDRGDGVHTRAVR